MFLHMGTIVGQASASGQRACEKAAREGEISGKFEIETRAANPALTGEEGPRAGEPSRLPPRSRGRPRRAATSGAPESRAQPFGVQLRTTSAEALVPSENFA